MIKRLLLKIAEKINKKYGIALVIDDYFYTNWTMLGENQKWAIVSAKLEREIGHIDTLTIVAHEVNNYELK